MKRSLVLTIIFMLQALPAFAVKTELTPVLRAGVEHTDNVNRTGENTEDETIYTISPGAALAFTGRVSGLSLNYYPTYAAYREKTQDDTWRHYAGLLGWWDLSARTRLDISDSLVISDDPADDIEDPTIRQGRQKYYRNTARINLGHQFGGSDFFDLGYIYSTLENDADVYEDSKRHNPYADMTWWFVPNRYGLDLHGDFLRGDFDRSDDFDSWTGRIKLRQRYTKYLDAFLQYGYIKTEYDGETENYQVHDAGIGLNYVVGEHITTSFAVNYVYRDREVSDSQDGIVPTWDIVGRWDWKRSSLNLTGRSGYDQDAFGAESSGFYLYSGIHGLFDYRFTRRLSGDISGGYRYTKYLDYDPEREDNNITAAAGLSWQALTWMRFRLGYSYSTIYSDEERNEYDENRIYFSVNLTPRKPILLSK